MTYKVDDQAEQLKKLLAEVDQKEEEQLVHDNENQEIDKVAASDPLIPKIDVLNLPPRKEIHGNGKNRTRLKIGRPFLRFLVVTLIFILVVISAYIYWGEELISLLKEI